MSKKDADYQEGLRHGRVQGLHIAAKQMSDQAVAYFDMGRDEEAQLWRKWSKDLRDLAAKEKP